MAGRYGVKETKELFDLGLALALAGKEALADGKVNIFDVAVVIPVLPKITPAVEGAEVSLKELLELDEADSAELLAYAKLKLPSVFTDAELLKKVTAAVKAGLAVAEVVSAFKVVV